MLSSLEMQGTEAQYIKLFEEANPNCTTDIACSHYPPNNPGEYGRQTGRRSLWSSRTHRWDHQPDTSDAGGTGWAEFWPST